MSRRVLRIVAMALLAASESGAAASSVPTMALLSSLLLLFVVAGTGTVVVGGGGGNAATLVVIEASRERSMMKLSLPLPVVEMASVAAVLVADCIMQILLIEEFDDRRHDVRIGVPAKIICPN